MSKLNKIIIFSLSVLFVVVVIVVLIFCFSDRYKEYKQQIIFQEIVGYAATSSDEYSLYYKYYNVKKADESFFQGSAYLIGLDNKIEIDGLSTEIILSNDLYEEKDLKISFTMNADIFQVEKIEFGFEGKIYAFELGSLIIEKIVDNSLSGSFEIRYNGLLRDFKMELSIKNLHEEVVTFQELIYGLEPEIISVDLENEESITFFIDARSYYREYARIIFRPSIKYTHQGLEYYLNMGTGSTLYPLKDEKVLLEFLKGSN
ncbi:MAG: hypothetical protein PHX62_07695 [Bacilli bacterium]|nr:hypothetical protein [Bacilli bacterium]